MPLAFAASMNRRFCAFNSKHITTTIKKTIHIVCNKFQLEYFEYQSLTFMNIFEKVNISTQSLLLYLVTIIYRLHRIGQ